MRGRAGMGQDKTMRGGDEDPILRPRPIAIPSSNTIEVSNFVLLAKKQNPTNETTYIVKDFSLFAKFLFN